MSSSKIITLSGWDISQINNDMSMNDICISAVFIFPNKA